MGHERIGLTAVALADDCMEKEANHKGNPQPIAQLRQAQTRSIRFVRPAIALSPHWKTRHTHRAVIDFAQAGFIRGNERASPSLAAGPTPAVGRALIHLHRDPPGSIYEPLREYRVR